MHCMEKTLLWEAFAALSPAEVREFGKFVRSPFFNTRPQLVEWFDFLSECRAQENASLPLPEHLEEGLGVRLANSALLALLEKYLVYKEKFSDEQRGKIRLAAAYRKRNLGRHFQITLREARQSRERQPWRHADYYHDLNLIEWEQYQFDTAQKRTDSLNIQATSDLMDTSFVARKLRLACLAVSHQAVYKTEYRIGLLDAVLAESERMADIPAVGLYFHCYHFLTDPFDQGEGHFGHFREMLAACADSFPKEELRTLYLLAINFGIKKANESRAAWLRNTLDLYQAALALELLLENGQISRFAFTNIVAIAVRVGEADWAEKFILEYRPKARTGMARGHGQPQPRPRGLRPQGLFQRPAPPPALRLQRHHQQHDCQDIPTENLLRNRRTRPAQQPPRQPQKLRPPPHGHRVSPHQLHPYPALHRAADGVAFQ